VLYCIAIKTVNGVPELFELAEGLSNWLLELA
jgi:hypothetical protein